MIHQCLDKPYQRSYRQRNPLIRRVIARTPEKGAETGLYLSVSSEAMGHTGQYFKDKKIAKTTQLVDEIALQNWLWGTSVELSKFEYPEFQ